jgi:hypothetical protein
MDNEGGRSTALSALYYFFLPASIGIVFGLLVGLDPLLGYLYPIVPMSFTRWVPFIFSPALIALFLCVSLWIAYHRKLFAWRYEIAALVILASGALSGVNFGPIDPTDFAFLSIFFFWLSASFIERRPIAIPTPVLIMLLLLAACSLGSVVNGRGTSLFSQHQMMTKYAMVFMVANLISTAALQKFMIKALVAISLLSALVGIAAEAAFLSTGYVFTFDDLPEYIFKETPFGNMLRAPGFLPRAQAQSHLLLLATSIVLFMPLRMGCRIVFLGILTLGLIFTFSVGAYLTLALVGMIALVMHRPQHFNHYLVGGVTLMLIAYFSGLWDWAYQEVLLSTAGKPAEDRISYLQIGFQAIARHPYLGIGLRNIARVLHTPVHNAYIQTAVEMGIAAGVIFTALVVYLTVGCGLAAGRQPRGDQRDWLLGLFMGMVGLALHISVEPFYDNYITWVYMGLTTAALATHQRHRLEQGRPHHAPHREISLVVEY